MDQSLAELNRLAAAASSTDALESEVFPTNSQISRWQTLFHYSRPEAISLIKAQRSGLTRTRITDEHWELVRGEKEAAGHDRETYEHSSQLGEVLKGQNATVTGSDGKVMFLFRLGGLLGTRDKVRDVAGLSEAPKVMEGQNEMGVASFCLVDEEAKDKIEKWLAQAQLGVLEEKK